MNMPDKNKSIEQSKTNGVEIVDNVNQTEAPETKKIKLDTIQVSELQTVINKIQENISSLDHTNQDKFLDIKKKLEKGGDIEFSSDEFLVIKDIFTFLKSDESLDIEYKADIQKMEDEFDTKYALLNLQTTLYEQQSSQIEIPTNPDEVKKMVISEVSKEIKDKWYYSTLNFLGFQEYLEAKINGTKPDGRLQKTGRWVFDGIVAIIGFDFLKNFSLDKAVKYLKDKLGGAKGLAKNAGERIKQKLENSEFLNKEKQKMIMKSKDFFEKTTGKKFDSDKFNKAFDIRWNSDLANIKSDLTNSRSGSREAILGSGTRDGAHALSETLMLGPKTIMSLTASLVKSGLFDLGDIAIEMVEDGGKFAFRYAIKSVGLISDFTGWLSGNIDTDDLAEITNGVKLDPDERMLLRGGLYRHGGILKTFLKGIGNISGVMINAMLGDNVGDMVKDVKAGALNDLKSQLDSIQRLSKKIGNTTIFDSIESMQKLVGTLEENIIVTATAKSASTAKEFFADFDRVAKENNINVNTEGFAKGIATNLNIDINGKTQEELISAISSNPNRKSKIAIQMENNLNNHIGTNLSKVDKVFNFLKIDRGPRRSLGYKKELKGLVDSGIELQKKQISGNIDRVWTKLKKYKNLRSIEDLGNRGAFNLKTAKDAEDFVSDMKFIASKSPEVLGQIAKNVPLILVGNEVINSIEAKNSVGTSIINGLKSITPFFGGLNLISEGLFFDKGHMDGSKLMAGIVSVSYDGYTLMKLTAEEGLRKGLVKFLLDPFVDFTKLAWSTGSTLIGAGFKTAKVVRSISYLAKNGELTEVAQGFGKLLGKQMLKGMGKFAVLGMMAYGGYKLGEHRVEEYDGDQQEKKQMELVLKQMESKTPTQIETNIREEYSKLNTDEEKKGFLEIRVRIATWQRLGLSSMDNVTSFDITGNQIKTTLSCLSSKDQRDQATDIIQESLLNLTGKNYNITYETTTLTYKEHYNELLAERKIKVKSLEDLKKELSDEDANSLFDGSTNLKDFVGQRFQSELVAMGETEQFVNQVLSQIQ